MNRQIIPLSDISKTITEREILLDETIQRMDEELEVNKTERD